MEIKVNKSFFNSIKNLCGIKHVYYEVRAWIKYHIFSKDFWHLLGTVLKSYPWQETYLLELERAKLIEMANYIEKYKRFVGWEYVVRDIRICVTLIHIMLEEELYYHYNGNLLFEPSEEYEGDYEVKHTDDFEYVCDIKVNTKNANRFFDNEKAREYAVEHPHELYIQKAMYLYHKIRYERENEWWD